MCLITVSPAQAGDTTTDLVPTDRGALFAPVPCDVHPCAKCDLEREDCKKIGASVECVSKEPGSHELLWYNSQRGRCEIIESTPTQLAFTVMIDSGVSFTNAPYTFVLYPSEVASHSNMSNYVGQALALALLPPNSDALYYIGSVGTVRDDGVALLTGERLGGSGTFAVGQTVPCVLDKVKDVVGSSAFATGTCTYSGDGRVVVAVDDARTFTGAGVISETTDLTTFKGLNAGSSDDGGDFEVFTISEANNTHLSGTTYFSTRPKTWTGLEEGVVHVERCGVFVDAAPCSKSTGTYNQATDHCYQVGSFVDSGSFWVPDEWQALNPPQVCWTKRKYCSPNGKPDFPWRLIGQCGDHPCYVDSGCGPACTDMYQDGEVATPHG